MEEAAGTLFFELGLVVLGMAVLARLAGRLGLSPIPFYLLAGFAFGHGGVLPLLTAQDFIRVGAELGVILLLFMLGLEYTGRELTSAMRNSAPAGAVDLALNFTPGVVAALLLGWEPIAAVFLGGVTYISSSGIVSKLVTDLGWVANRETPVVLSTLVFEDLVMVLYLPLVTALLLGEGGLSGVAVSTVVAIGALGITLLAALVGGPHLSRLVLSRSDEALLLTLLGITLVVAGLSDMLRASAAVGAFLVGIAVSGPAAESARSLLRPLRDVFAATFFFFFGLETDPAAIPPVLVAALALAAVTAWTKRASAGWACRRLHVGADGRRRAGALLIARGEFSIIIAGLATSASIEPELTPLAAAYVLTLAIAGPVAAKITDVRVHADRRRHREQALERRRRMGGPYGV